MGNPRTAQICTWLRLWLAGRYVPSELLVTGCPVDKSSSTASNGVDTDFQAAGRTKRRDHEEGLVGIEILTDPFEFSICPKSKERCGTEYDIARAWLSCQAFSLTRNDRPRTAAAAGEPWPPTVESC